MVRGTVLGVLALASALGTVAPQAQASTGYRYWSYWNAAPDANSWVYATQGSGTHVPDDGAVEGWRFGVAGETSSIRPGPLPDFAQVCSGVPTPADGKRVAVVIDPGDPAEAPAGESPPSPRSECVVGAAGATGPQLLQTVAQVRVDAGFVCGIGGYPASECAPLVDMQVPATQVSANEVKADTSTAQKVERTSDDTTGIGSPLISAAAVTVLAMIGFGLWRKSRRSRV